MHVVLTSFVINQNSYIYTHFIENSNFIPKIRKMLDMSYNVKFVLESIPVQYSKEYGSQLADFKHLHPFIYMYGFSSILLL